MFWIVSDNQGCRFRLNHSTNYSDASVQFIPLNKDVKFNAVDGLKPCHGLSLSKDNTKAYITSIEESGDEQYTLETVDLTKKDSTPTLHKIESDKIIMFRPDQTSTLVVELGGNCRRVKNQDQLSEDICVLESGGDYICISLSPDLKKAAILKEQGVYLTDVP
jgi:hypothetical protein